MTLLASSFSLRNMSAMRRWILLCLTLLCYHEPASAQEPAYMDDFRAAEQMRRREDRRDLAKDWLLFKKATASPEMLKELPLEMAKTGLQMASMEPDTTRRLVLYREARDDFQKFISANPGHPRVAEAYLDIARTLNLQGKTELNRAKLAGSRQEKVAQMAQARQSLVKAAEGLDGASKALKAQKAILPDPDTIDDPAKKKQVLAAHKNLENEISLVSFEKALNLYDQAEAITNDAASGAMLGEARKAMSDLKDGTKDTAGLPPTNPLYWKSIAWTGRIIFDIATADEARAKFSEVINAEKVPAAAEGLRLARYFRLLVMDKKPDEKADGKGKLKIIERGEAWLRDYPSHLKTAEGYGVAYLLAKSYMFEESQAKLGPTKDAYRAKARSLLRNIERSENEFTELARQLKIQVMKRQGGFDKPINKLDKFEDCYVRAQYEASMMGKEDKEGKGEKVDSKKRMENIIEALQHGLKLVQKEKEKPDFEIANARSWLAYWSLTAGNFKDAIQAGETYAREDPRASQAELAAVYALQAYGQLLLNPKGDDYRTQRDKMLSLCSFALRFWPRGTAGNLARHSAGLQLMREGNHPEAIKFFSMITPDYASYPLVCYQVADSCLKQDAALRDDPEGATIFVGDARGDFRKRAMMALESMPESALGSDPFTNQIVLAGKAMLGRQWFNPYRRFREMGELSTRMLDRLGKVELPFDSDADETKKGKVRDQLKFEFIDIGIFAKYGIADTAFSAGDNEAAAAALDSIIESVNKSGPEKFNLEKNSTLARQIFLIALRANMLIGKIDKADSALEAMDQTGGEGDGGNSLRILSGLIRTQLEEVRKKGDKEAEARLIKGGSDILNKRVAKVLKPNTEFIRDLATCYASMDRHDDAAQLLLKVPDPKAVPKSKEATAFYNIQLLLMRELRLSKKTENIKQARVLMDKAMGDAKKPGWGSGAITVRREQCLLLEEEKRWAEAGNEWNKIARFWKIKINEGAQEKENFFESHYHVLYCNLKIGQKKASQSDRNKQTSETARLIVNFETSWPDFGSDTSKKRFTDWLGSEPELRSEYNKLRNKK